VLSWGHVAAEGTADTAEDPVDELTRTYADRLADTPRARQALRIIVESALDDAAPITLPSTVREAYEVLDAEAGAGHAGPGATPGDDRDPFDAEATYQACQLEEITSFGGVSFGGVLAPLRVLTFWQMKRRACAFGETGAADLLAGLQDAAPNARFHLMGHSFGCIVASAAVAGPARPAQRRRPVDTLSLVQGAMSLWSFCDSIPVRPRRAGYFHRVVADELVRGPILATTTVHDRAVRTFYPIGAFARTQVAYAGDADLPRYGAIGAFGVRGSGVTVVDDRLHPVEEPYGFRPGTVYDLDADEVICHSEGLMGAHSDICHPPVAHAIWQAVLAT
jgi:hypothetical protein